MIFINIYVISSSSLLTSIIIWPSSLYIPMNPLPSDRLRLVDLVSPNAAREGLEGLRIFSLARWRASLLSGHPWVIVPIRSYKYI